MKSLELLAPARNADFGIAAIDHGADAVYIGGPAFSARAAAANELKDIERLIRHAHVYNAGVYAALNTILSDTELEAARRLIVRLYEIGIDALIIQDMGLLEMDLPPVPLIASTQAHNSTPSKVRFLEDVGFQRVILARELSLTEITAIRRETRVALECFVHGALCVSYSGRCYMSQALGGRSANRGVCAQPCRSVYSLVDGDGATIVRDKHLLSLKDLNLSDALDDLIRAGITSFKIEGRYKDLSYVKNVTAAYRQALDAAMKRLPQTVKSSSGRCRYEFRPDLATTFNRGYTEYFLKGRNHKTGSPDTQKSIGKKIAAVTRVNRKSIVVDGGSFENGDGLCFLGPDGVMDGFQVNTVQGRLLVPHRMPPAIEPGTLLYRNFDQALSRVLKNRSAERRIGVTFEFFRDDREIGLTAVDEDGHRVRVTLAAPYVPARNPGQCREQLQSQLSRLGDSIYFLEQLRLADTPPGFLPVRVLNRLRRETVTRLTEVRLQNRHRRLLSASDVSGGKEALPTLSGMKPEMPVSSGLRFRPLTANDVPYPEKRLDYRANVMNRQARAFYERHNAMVVEPALETFSCAPADHAAGKVVMTTRYCIRYELDACPRHSTPCRKLKGPLLLKGKNHSFELSFDCEACRMRVVFRA